MAITTRAVASKTIVARSEVPTWLRQSIERLRFADEDMIHRAKERIRDMLTNGDDRTAIRAANAMWLGERMLAEIAGEAETTVSITQTIESLDDNSQRQAIYSLLGQLTGSPVDDNPAQLSSDAIPAAALEAEKSATADKGSQKD